VACIAAAADAMAFQVIGAHTTILGVLGIGADHLHPRDPSWMITMR